MDWVQSLNGAIAYIEDNILTPISCSEIANHVYTSNSHFQRTFCLLTGYTIGEYVRNRRLTLAGQELLEQRAKVIDIALKYGYETPESFSKAFSRFHGISPVQARRAGAHLKAFQRLTIKIVMEGGSIMDYKIVKEDSFNVVVKAKLFTEDESTEGCPAFWDEFFEEGLEKKLVPDLAVCGELSASGKEFSYGIGCREECVKEMSEDFETWTIPASTWAVFKCVGPMPHAIQDMYKKIYSEWLPQSKYELASGKDFEKYFEGDPQSADYVSEIWIPVKEK